ncbi:hypothetical protein B0H14DRAFT_3429893 [Mycena olivaceomarginata]|nr:hypothetical protein B0H14DRAFT_3429893 [Mycena olivaceomarginata]
MIKNHYDTTDKPSRPIKPTDSSAERKPRAASAIAMFRKEHEAEIVRDRDSEAARQAAAREPITHLLDTSVKAEMEEHAHRANEAIEAGPTPEDIAKNQETVDTAIVKKLKSLMGHGWAGHGYMVFFVRAGFVNRDNKIATLCLAVGPRYTVEPYASSREDEETKEFAEYAVKVLSPAPPSEPTLEVDSAGNAVLPKIKTKNTPSETLRQLLKGYAAIKHAATSVILVSADSSQVDLDNASREDFIIFYNQIRQLRKAGTEVSVTVGTGKAPANGPDPLGGASCQPTGEPGTPINAVPASGTTVLSSLPHANAPAHPEGSPTALVNPGPPPANISGDTATVLPDITLPGPCAAVTDIEPHMEPVVAPAVNAAVKVEVAHAGESRKGIFGAQGTGAGEYKGLLKQGNT